MSIVPCSAVQQSLVCFIDLLHYLGVIGKWLYDVYTLVKVHGDN